MTNKFFKGLIIALVLSLALFWLPLYFLVIR